MSPRPPRALLPRGAHDAAPDRRDLAAIYAIGLNAYDPVRGEWLGATPRPDESRRSRLLALLDRARQMAARVR